MEGDHCEGLITYKGSVIAESVDDLAMLEGIQCVTGGIYINQYQDAQLDYVQALEVIGGGLSVVWPGDTLVSLAGFDSLREIHGSLFIQGVGFGSLEGLEALEFAGYIELTENALPSLAGLNGLVTVEGWFLIGDELEGNGIESLDALTSLEYVGTELMIYRSKVTSIEGFQNLQEVGLNVAILDNPMLPTCLALEFAQIVNTPNYSVVGNLADECG
jgi:hypothetical protein